MLGTLPISISPYRMAPVKLKVLKTQLEELLHKGFSCPSAYCGEFLSSLFRKRMDHFIYISIIGNLTKLLPRINIYFLVLMMGSTNSVG